MKNFLKSLFGNKDTSTENPPEENDDLELAVAALLVEAARSDENYTDKEVILVEASLSSMFDLSQIQAGALRAKAEIAQAEAIDLHRFTKIAKTLPIEDKVRLLESLWRIILSDETRDPHEDALVRRLCGLIYISDVESGKARQRVVAEG